MSAKQYLKQYGVETDRINTLEQDLKDLREQREAISINLDGMPHGTALSDKTGRLAVQLADYEEKIIEALSRAWSIREDIVSTIGELENSTYSTLLYKRYIEFKTWEQIAVEMHYSYMHVTRIHGYALTEIDKKL